MVGNRVVLMGGEGRDRAWSLKEVPLTCLWHAHLKAVFPTIQDTF